MTPTRPASRAVAGRCTLTPTETQGRTPLLAILSNAAMVRSDIRQGKTVRFTTIYPRWYAGRVTHIHFQAYLTNNLQVTATSQLAFPPEVTTAV